MSIITEPPGRREELRPGTAQPPTVLEPRSTAETALELFTTAAPLLLVDLATVIASLAVVEWVFETIGAPMHDAFLLYRGLPATIILVLLLSGLCPAIAWNVIVETRRLILCSTAAFGAFLLAICAVDPDRVNLAGVACAWVLTTIALPCLRTFARSLLARTTWWGRSAALIGDYPRRRGAVRRLRAQGLRPIPTKLDPGDPQTWQALARSSPAYVIVFADEPWPPALAQAEALGIPNVLVVTPSLTESIGSLWLEPVEVGGASAFHIRNGIQMLRHRLLKRALDVGLILACLPVLLPLVVVIATLVRISSPGPLFFGHRRLGKGGRWFKAWKFRTMVVDADTRLRDYLDRHPEAKREWDATQKLRDDPRITRIGRFLRKASLDELPQLWNVFLGQMSLVGPRPIVENEITRYGEKYAFYTRVLPGLTGLWQIAGRNDTTYPERVRLDAAYVRNWSIWLDLYILFRTVRTVLFAEGAY